MKFFLTCSLITVVLAGLLIACGGNQEQDLEEWKEMDEFHLVMAEVYHPLKDSGDVSAIRNRAGELAAAAETWAGSEVPEKVDNDEVKGLLEKLKGGTRDLESEIANGATDEDISVQLTDLHDLFHHLQEKWYEEGEEHGEQH